MKLSPPLSVAECFTIPLLALLGGLAFDTLVFSSSGYMARYQLEQRRDRLQALSQRLGIEQQKLKERYRDMQNEDFALKVAGHKYLLLDEDSNILKFVDPAARQKKVLPEPEQMPSAPKTSWRFVFWSILGAASLGGLLYNLSRVRSLGRSQESSFL
jgi:hypothetical protein